MSVLAMLSLTYFFLLPVGMFTIADPQNWVALFVFLLVSITGSQLSNRIRLEADEANQRRREVSASTASAASSSAKAMSSN